MKLGSGPLASEKNAGRTHRGHPNLVMLGMDGTEGLASVNAVNGTPCPVRFFWASDSSQTLAVAVRVVHVLRAYHIIFFWGKKTEKSSGKEVEQSPGSQGRASKDTSSKPHLLNHEVVGLVNRSQVAAEAVRRTAEPNRLPAVD